MSGIVSHFVYKSYRLQKEKNIFQINIDQIIFCFRYVLENVNPIHDGLIAVHFKVLIVTGRVPRIERMVTNDVQRMLGQVRFVVFQHTVQVFVMAPGHGQISDSTLWLVHSAVGAVWMNDQIILAIGFNHRKANNLGANICQEPRGRALCENLLEYSLDS